MERDGPKPAGVVPRCWSQQSGTSSSEQPAQPLLPLNVVAGGSEVREFSFLLQHEHGRVSGQHWRHLHPRPAPSHRHPSSLLGCTGLGPTTEPSPGPTSSGAGVGRPPAEQHLGGVHSTSSFGAKDDILGSALSSCGPQPHLL